ncbi:MAG: hypothetical protein VX930_03970, partial [Pseudomonadota bacterium]|nr:hypothetical protein [Pseudomonadota bacterium]
VGPWPTNAFSPRTQAACRVRLHVCWGNYESPHDRDVALKDILPAILEADVGAFLLPFANRAISMKLSCFGKGRYERTQRILLSLCNIYLTNSFDSRRIAAK